jgi:hypothetical protein
MQTGAAVNLSDRTKFLDALPATVLSGYVNHRRANLTPPAGTPMPGLPPTRRAGGARREVSDRVALHADDGTELTGWALNISRGGVRAIVEEQIELGAVFSVVIGEDPTRRRGRVVWLQEEPDGAIVGIEFLPGHEVAGATDTAAGAPAQHPVDDALAEKDGGAGHGGGSAA